MSLTLALSSCFCPGHLQSKLRSLLPAVCEKAHVQGQPLYPAAFTLSGSFQHDFFKAPGQGRQGVF